MNDPYQLDYEKFYPGKWRTSSAIQSLSFFEKGVYWELRCFLFGAQRRGWFVENGDAIPDDVICRMLGIDPELGVRLLNRFIKSGLLERDKYTQAIFDRKMSSADKNARVRVMTGKMGGSPILLGKKHLKLVEPPPPPPEPTNGKHKPQFTESFPLNSIPLGPVHLHKPDPLDGAKAVLRHLNFAADRNFREIPETLKVIKKWLDSVDNDIDGVKMMIDRMVAMWKGDPKMERFLRPDTLFCGKFNGYYDDRKLPTSPLLRAPERNQMQETFNMPVLQ